MMSRRKANTCQALGSTGFGTLNVLLILLLSLMISPATDGLNNSNCTSNIPTSTNVTTATINPINTNCSNSSTAMQNPTTQSSPTQSTASNTNASTPSTLTYPPTTTSLPDSTASSSTTNKYQLNKPGEALPKVPEGPFEIGPERRIVFNKPTMPQAEDYAPNSPEARISDATAQFGLDFMKNLPESSEKGNIVISPLSLQCLMNMLLLGAPDNSTTQMELITVLGYGKTELLRYSEERLKAHEAMHNVLESIMKATHLSINSNLLNANVGEFQSSNSKESSGKLAAHLQTSVRGNDTPLTQQVNFTLANLILTNKQLIQLSSSYEHNLKTYYDVAIEEFQLSPSKSSNSSSPTGQPITTKVRGKPKVQLPIHDRVNNWIKNKTHSQIDKLVTEADLKSEDLIMVLLNAAHFKGRWLHTFNPKATHEMTFFNNGLEKGATSVSFMRQKGVFGYADYGTAVMQAEGAGIMPGVPEYPLGSGPDDSDTVLTINVPDSGPANQQSDSQPPVIELSKEETKRLELTSKINCSVLMLPFSLNDGQELSMVILLPTKKDGLPELQQALSGPALNEIYKSLSEQQVQVEIPKFSFEGSHDAKSSLYKLGLKSIFQDDANLDLMYERSNGNNNGTQTANRGAKVDKVIHKAKISVDESGAEAAAASMASIVLRNFIRPPTPVFVADHPFLFIIRHNRSNMPLFMGRVNSL